MIKKGKKGIWIAVPIPKLFWKKKDGSINTNRKIPGGIYNFYLNVKDSSAVMFLAQYFIGKQINAEGFNAFLIDVQPETDEILKFTVKIGDPTVIAVVAVLAGIGIASFAVSQMLVKIERLVYISYPLLVAGGAFYIYKEVKK